VWWFSEGLELRLIHIAEDDVVDPDPADHPKPPKGWYIAHNRLSDRSAVYFFIV